MGKAIGKARYLIVISIILIAVLSSCEVENNSMELCKVKLGYDSSRSFSDTTFSSKLDNSFLTYKATYMGKGQSYGSTSGFSSYPREGLVLSQGPWVIDCKWMKEGTLIAEGTTREIWVNLNTKSLLVYLEENEGKGSFLLDSYKVKNTDNSVTAVNFTFEIMKWDSGQFTTLSLEPTITYGTESDYIKTCRLEKDNLDAGQYILAVNVYNGDTQTSSNLLFTDVIGFTVREGHQTKVSGECEVKSGVKYIEWEPNPSNPSDTNGKVVEAANGNENTGTTIDLTTGAIQNETIYILQEDKKTDGTGTGKIDLGHQEGDITSNRILTPVPDPKTNVNAFAIDMNGTDVTVSSPVVYDVPSKTVENTTIVQLNERITMNLFNSSADSASWGVSHSSSWFKTRTDANVKLNGGTLNVIGNGDSENISKGAIVFLGPTKNDSATTLIQKQGAVNMEGVGGKVVLDGEVTVKGLLGISSFASGSTNSSLTGDPIYVDITAINSTIEAEATKKTFGLTQETSYGIYLKCSNQGGTINIVLDGATITAKGSGENISESGIRIDDFSGNINITIKNGSTISSEVGNGLYFSNCTGDINITLDNTKNSITGGMWALKTSGSPKIKITKGGVENNISSSLKNTAFAGL